MRPLLSKACVGKGASRLAVSQLQLLVPKFPRSYSRKTNSVHLVVTNCVHWAVHPNKVQFVLVNLNGSQEQLSVCSQSDKVDAN